VTESKLTDFKINAINGLALSACFNDNSLNVIVLATGEIMKRIPVGTRLHAIVASHDEKTMYVG